MWSVERASRYEGMLVQPTGDYRLASTHELFNFGSLWLSAGGNLVKSTETTDAGPAADAIAAANQAKLLLVDDGYSIQVGNAQHVGEQPYFTTGTVVRGGDRFVPPAKPMVLGFGFDRWRLQPQVPITDASAADYKPTFETLNPRPAAAPVVGGDVQFGAFNVFNYFTTFGGEARGAANPAQFAIQKAKIVTAINGLGADVVALQEIENSVELGEPVDEALADLVDGLNAAAGAGTWDLRAQPRRPRRRPGNDVITSAIIYKPAVATPVGDSFADTDAVWDIARDPVAQTFDIGGDRIVTVVANHFKSKSPPAGGGTEPADGQGFFNAERTAQAERLATFAATIAADPEKGDDILLLGDFNAYGAGGPDPGARRGRLRRPRADGGRGRVHLHLQRRARLARPRARERLARASRSPTSGCGASTRPSGATVGTRSPRTTARASSARATTTRSCSASRRPSRRSRSTC